MSRDPMAASPAWLESHFGYAGASPTSASDPTGLEVVEMQDEFGSYYMDDANGAIWNEGIGWVLGTGEVWDDASGTWKVAQVPSPPPVVQDVPTFNEYPIPQLDLNYSFECVDTMFAAQRCVNSSGYEWNRLRPAEPDTAWEKNRDKVLKECAIGAVVGGTVGGVLSHWTGPGVLGGIAIGGGGGCLYNSLDTSLRLAID